MPLAIAPVGVVLTVMKVLTDEQTKKHLQDLGITVGGELKIISVKSGSVIAQVKDGRLALDKNVAMKIFVK